MVIKSQTDPYRGGLWALKLGLGGFIPLTEEVIYKHDGILAIFKNSLRRRNDGYQPRTGSRESLVKKKGMNFGP